MPETTPCQRPSLDNYQNTIETGLQATLKQIGLPGSGGKEKQKQALVVFGSDQGLCGRFNEKLVEFLQKKTGGRTNSSKASYSRHWCQDCGSAGGRRL